MIESQTITLRPPVWALILAVAIGGSFYIYGKHVEVDDETPTIVSVSGEGKVSAVPDIAELTFGMQTGRQATAKAAMDKLEKTMNAVFDAVKKTGIEEKDIQHEQFSLNPSYDWTTGSQVLRGYEASQTLRVKVHDLDKVTEVLGAATAAGANQAGDVNFTIDDPEALRAEAREKAIEKAKEQAKKLASQLGMSLGDIKSFSEDGGSYPPVPMMYSAKMDAAGAVAEERSIPLPPGQQDVIVNVTLTYELD